MNKSEFVDAIAEQTGSTKAEAGRFVDAIFGTITNELSTGGQIVIPSFGAFSVGHRAARPGRNPQTGQTIEIKAARVAKFKVGKALKEAVAIEA